MPVFRFVEHVMAHFAGVQAQSLVNTTEELKAEGK